MGGNLGSERAAEDEVLVRAGVEEVKERIGGPGSNVFRNPPQSALMSLSPVPPLVDPFYIR